MRESLEVIRKLRPRSMLLENVLGIADIMKGEDKSALTIITEDLDNMGYKTLSMEMDLGEWINIVRPRIDPHHTCLRQASSKSQDVIVFVVPVVHKFRLPRRSGATVVACL